MMFSKATVEVLKIDNNDIVTTSCARPGYLVDECEFGG